MYDPSDTMKVLKMLLLARFMRCFRQPIMLMIDSSGIGLSRISFLSGLSDFKKGACGYTSITINFANVKCLCHLYRNRRKLQRLWMKSTTLSPFICVSVMNSKSIKRACCNTCSFNEGLL